ncbi:STAS domain-containing protein [Nisaea denitrificans]|uniref:STAS domain-containing protein n=1 Tax=Nisaea denitrificans TaxID=390877 RepID=UPI00041DFA23|nr:STAS domain-containing protein [Nisaea denitrificans]
MEIRIRSDSSPLSITLEGSLDGTSASALRDQFFDVSLTTSGAVIVDISAVDFMDSVGLGLLVSFYRQLGAKGRLLHVIGATGQPNDLLRITGSGRVLCLPIAENVA